MNEKTKIKRKYQAKYNTMSRQKVTKINGNQYQNIDKCEESISRNKKRY